MTDHRYTKQRAQAEVRAQRIPGGREQIAFDYTNKQQTQLPYREPRPAQSLIGSRYTAASHVQGHTARTHPEDVPYSSDDVLSEEEQGEEFYDQRSRTSIQTYAPLQPAPRTQFDFEERPEVIPSVRRKSALKRSTLEKQQVVQKPVKQRRRFHLHWSVIVGLTMIGTLALWIAGTAGLNWYPTWQDDLHYGRPRSFQIDAVVGHDDSPSNPTHFIALNLKNQNGIYQIQIVELPGGDSSKAKIYAGPTLYGGSDSAGLIPVTLSFEDTQHNGHPEMIVHFQNSEIIYLNAKVDGTWKFEPKH